MSAIERETDESATAANTLNGAPLFCLGTPVPCIFRVWWCRGVGLVRILHVVPFLSRVVPSKYAKLRARLAVALDIEGAFNLSGGIPIENFDPL